MTSQRRVALGQLARLAMADGILKEYSPTGLLVTDDLVLNVHSVSIPVPNRRIMDYSHAGRDWGSIGRETFEATPLFQPNGRLIGYAYAFGEA